MSRTKRIESAARLFEDFTGHQAEEVIEVDLPDHDTHMVVGEVEAIQYRTTRDGESNSYRHDFKKSARPILTASHDGSSLYLLDGAYRFTDAGIEDDMAHIALVNPARRKTKSRKHRTAAQRAATRKLVALNRARRHGGGRKRRHTTRHTTHHAKRRRHATRHVAHHASKRMRRRARRHSTHMRVNPIGRGFMPFLKDEVLPGVVGGAAALGLDVAIGMLPLPAIVQTNTMVRTATKLAGALGVGYLAGKMTSKKTGEAIAAGAFTVILYDMLKGFLVSQFPQLPIVPTATVVIPTGATTATTTGVSGEASAIGWTAAGPQVGYQIDGMGEEDYIYTGDEMRGMGAYIKAF